MQQNAEPKNKSQISDYQNCWVQMKIAATWQLFTEFSTIKFHATMSSSSWGFHVYKQADCINSTDNTPHGFECSERGTIKIQTG
jgi:hypothetical protein